MKTKTKLNLQLLSAVIVTIVGCGLLIAGFIVDPLGIVHSSVLTAFGETSTFAGALFGIEYTYRYKSNIDKKEKDQE